MFLRLESGETTDRGLDKHLRTYTGETTHLLTRT
jgi:hypothetical protein